MVRSGKVTEAIFLAWPPMFMCFLLSVKLVFVDRREVRFELEEPEIDWPPKDGRLPPR